MHMPAGMRLIGIWAELSGPIAGYFRVSVCVRFWISFLISSLLIVVAILAPKLSYMSHYGSQKRSKRAKVAKAFDPKQLQTSFCCRILGPQGLLREPQESQEGLQDGLEEPSRS